MKNFLKKVWHFIWYEEDILTPKGFASFIVNLILAFIIIKFIFYPAIGFAFNSSYPIVAVLSESMEHQEIHPCSRYDIYGECISRDEATYEICGDRNAEYSYLDFDGYWQKCGSWYEKMGISKDMFSSFRLKNGFSKGDILIIYGAKPEQVKEGDIIVFESNRRYPVIHRVVKKYEEDGKVYYHTKGDHNVDSITEEGLNELKVLHDEKTFKGKAVLWIPYLGYVKILPVQIYKYIMDLMK